MNYEDILQKIQQDENNELRTDLYRYNGILEAIRFYANRLTFEQITDTAFDFVNELLTVNQSVMFLLSEDTYILKKSRGVSLVDRTLAITPELSGFALYVGNVVNGRKNLEMYFPSYLLDAVDANVMIPMILENRLTGFFLMSGRISAKFNENDILVCETLMNLFNNALESCQQLERLQVTNRELDEKIFNLFAINQSAKAMLTEHRLDELNHLAVDVFSELTLSANTGFILYDDASETYQLKAYRDVFHSSSVKNLGLTLKTDAPVNISKQIVDMAEPSDLSYFEALYEEGIVPLSSLKAKYIVFIYGKKGRILGFVTLGETVSGAGYKKSAFELVDSLASYTYIALSNAMLIKVVNDQKKQLQLKLDRLIRLNTLIKNINSAENIDRLMALALETLMVSFGVESCLITLYNKEKDELDVKLAYDLSLNGLTIPLNNRLEPIKEGKVLFESDASLVSDFVGEEISEVIRNKAGLLVIPITIERYDIELIGAIIIFKIKDSQLSNEENILTYETVANHMAPLLEGFMTMEKRIKEYKPDYAQRFMNELQAQIRECLEYGFDLEVIRVISKRSSPFADNNMASMLSDLFHTIYHVSHDQTYLVIQNDFEYNYQFIQSAIGNTDISIIRYKLNKDFSSMEEFLKLQE